MFALVLTALLAQTQVAPTPPAEIAGKVAEALARSTNTLALEADETVSPEELERVSSMLSGTKLFSVVAKEQAPVVVTLRRLESTVIVSAERPGGERLYVGQFTWPQTVAAAPAAAAPASSEEIYERVRKYEREKLRVVPVVQGMSSPSVVFMGGGPFARGPNIGFGGAFSTGTPTSTAPNDWVVMRGAAETIGDIELAEAAGNAERAQQLREDRFDTRLAWGVGFGLGAVAGIGGGTYLARRDERDTRALGISLITVGVASAAIALFAPAIARGHGLEIAETEELVDAHNADLRRKLQLSPDDVAKYRER